MNITLSNRVQAVKPSPTLAITARAAQMRAAGKDIIGLGLANLILILPIILKPQLLKPWIVVLLNIRLSMALPV